MNQQNQQGQSQNQKSNGNTQMVPEAKAALDNMKYEIAREQGIKFMNGYNVDL